MIVPSQALWAILVCSLACQYSVHAAPFQEWVNGLMLYVPALELADVHIPILGLFDLNITGGNCSTFDVMSLGGHASPFNAIDPHTSTSAMGGMNMSIEVTAGFDCTIEAAADISFLGKVPVTIKASILPTTSVKIGLAVATDLNETAPLPAAISIPISMCHMEVGLHSLSFLSSNRLVRGALNSFVSVTGLGEIGKLLDAGLCQQVLNKKLLKMLADINMLMSFAMGQLRIIHAFDVWTPLAPPVVPFGTAFDWHHLLDDTPIGHVLQAMSLDLGHLNNLTELNQEVSKFLSSPMVTKALAGPFHIKLPGANITAKKMLPSSAGLSMLDGSVSTEVLSSKLGVGKTGATVSIETSLFDFDNKLLKSINGPLDLQSTQVEIGVGKLGLAIGTFAYFDSKLLAQNHLDQLQNTSCLCRSLGPNPWGGEDLQFSLPSESTTRLGSLAVLNLNVAIHALSLQSDIGTVVPELKGLGLFASELINTTTEVFGSTMYTGVNGEGVRLLLDIINGKLYSFGAACEGQCPATMTGGLLTDEKDITNIMFVLGGMGFLFGFSCLFRSAWSLIQKKRRRELPVASEPTGSAALLVNCEENTGSLFSNKKVTRPVALAVPALFGCVFAMNVVAQTTWFLATAVVAGDGQRETSLDLGSFTIWGAIHALWASGSWYLSILVVLASIAFPYVKMAVTLSMWFLPATVLSVQKRELILVILDQIAKLALVDCCLFVLMIIGLQAKWTNGASNDIFLRMGAVEPTGFIAQIVAAFSSILVGQVVLLCHRAVGSERKRFIDHASVMTSQLSQSQTNIPQPRTGSGTSLSLAASPTSTVSATPERTIVGDTIASPERDNIGSVDASCGAPIHGNQIPDPKEVICFAHMVGKRRTGYFSFLLVATLALTLGGTFFVHIISFEYSGVAAVGLEVLGSPVYVSYSLLEILGGIYLTDYGIQFGEVFVTLVLVVFCFFIPVALIAALFMLWNVPLTAKAQFHTWVVLQVLQAWAGLDVFVVAVIAIGIFTSQVTEFLNYLIRHSNAGPTCVIVESAGVGCVVLHVHSEWPVVILAVAALSCHLCFLYVYRLMYNVREGKWALVD